MSTVTEERLQRLRAVLAPSIPDPDRLDVVMTQAREALGVEEDRRKGREKRRAYLQRLRETNGGTSYTATDRAYYEQNKAHLISNMVARQRVRRANAAATPAAANPASEAATNDIASP
jgi:hypothetical protein